MNGETKKNLKQFLIVAGALLTIAAIVITAIAIYLYNTKDVRAEEKRLRENQYAKDQVKSDTGITIPDDVEVIFNFSEVGRDPVHYTVFKFSEKPTDWLKDNGFKKTKNEEFEWFWSFGHYMNDYVPEEYHPNFNDEYYWFVKGRARLTYQPDTLELIFYIVNI